MTEATTKLVAEMLSQRLGIAPDQLETTIGSDPLAAALALSMTDHPRESERTDPAATVEFVAAIVGACPLCLGEQRGCSRCHGAGVPGSRQPDGDALIAWVARPLRRLGLCVAIRKPQRAGHTPGGGYAS